MSPTRNTVISGFRINWGLSGPPLHLYGLMPFVLYGEGLNPYPFLCKEDFIVATGKQNGAKQPGGTKGNLREETSTTGSQFDHLPKANSFANGNMERSNRSSTGDGKGVPTNGPTWDHMPKNPTSIGKRKGR